MNIKKKQSHLEGSHSYQDSTLGFTSEESEYIARPLHRDCESLSKDEMAFSFHPKLSRRQAGTHKPNGLPVDMDRNKSSSFISNSNYYSLEAAGQSSQDSRRPKNGQALQDSPTSHETNISDQYFDTQIFDNSAILNITENRYNSSLLSSQLYEFRNETQTSRSLRILRIDQLLAGHARSFWPQHSPSRRECKL